MTPLSTAFLVTAAVCGVAYAASHHFTTLRVVDGDTVAIGNTRYRLANHDAPEIFSPKCEAERQLGLKAKARLEHLLSGKYKTQVVNCLYGRRDQYGRQCMVIRVVSVAEGVTGSVIWTVGADVGDILISERLAVRFPSGAKPDWCGGNK